MKLKERSLLLQTPPLPPLQGDDVKLLQSELQQLGFALLELLVEPGNFFWA